MHARSRQPPGRADEPAARVATDTGDEEQAPGWRATQRNGAPRGPPALSAIMGRLTRPRLRPELADRPLAVGDVDRTDGHHACLRGEQLGRQDELPAVRASGSPPSPLRALTATADRADHWELRKPAFPVNDDSYASQLRENVLKMDGSAGRVLSADRLSSAQPSDQADASRRFPYAQLGRSIAPPCRGESPP